MKLRLHDPGWHSFLAGTLVLGGTTLGAELSRPIAAALTWESSAGPLSGQVGIAALAWAIAALWKRKPR